MVNSQPFEIGNNKKITNPNLIKLFPKWNKANRKGHASFFGLDFWVFRFVPINSELNSHLENQTYFYQSNGCGTKKNSQLEKVGWN